MESRVVVVAVLLTSALEAVAAQVGAVPSLVGGELAAAVAADTGLVVAVESSGHG